MLKTTKLDMDSVRASLKRENKVLLNRGFALPYLSNGEIKFTIQMAPKKKPKSKEFV